MDDDDAGKLRVIVMVMVMVMVMVRVGVGVRVRVRVRYGMICQGRRRGLCLYKTLFRHRCPPAFIVAPFTYSLYLLL